MKSSIQKSASPAPARIRFLGDPRALQKPTVSSAVSGQKPVAVVTAGMNAVALLLIKRRSYYVF
jgi:hypothetical protein